MSDIVERLRHIIPWCADINDLNTEAAAEIERLRREISYHVHTDEDIKVQNAEIERLRAENQTAWNKADDHYVEANRLRAALQKIAHVPATLKAKIDLARRTLEPKP